MLGACHPMSWALFLLWGRAAQDGIMVGVMVPRYLPLSAEVRPLQSLFLWWPLLRWALTPLRWGQASLRWVQVPEVEAVHRGLFWFRCHVLPFPEEA